MRLTCIVCACVSLLACGGQPQPAPAAANWATTRDSLVEDYLKAHPGFAVYQGRHEYDGTLPDWTANGIAAEVKRLHASRDKAMALADTSLSGPERFERDYLVARMDRDLFWLETAEAPFLNPAFYLDVDSLDPSPYLTRNYAPLETRLRAYTKYARSVQQAAAQIRANLRTPMSLPLLERGISAFKGFAEFYASDVPKVFAGVKDAALHKDFGDANAGAAKAMQDLAAWLESQRSTATAAYALGAEKFAKMVYETERVASPLAELEAAGRADLARNQRALHDACATYPPGATVQARRWQIGRAHV